MTENHAYHDETSHQRPGPVADEGRERVAGREPVRDSASAYPRRDPRYRNTALATVLSFLMPGLGQVYVGYYRDAFIDIAVIAGTITLLSSRPPSHLWLGNLDVLLGLFLAFFWLYQTIDAARKSSLYNQYLDGLEGVAPPTGTTLPGESGMRVAGGVLIVFGVLALLNTLFGVSLEWLQQWWPVIPIVGGIYLVRPGKS